MNRNGVKEIMQKESIGIICPIMSRPIPATEYAGDVQVGVRYWKGLFPCIKEDCAAWIESDETYCCSKGYGRRSGECKVVCDSLNHGTLDCDCETCSLSRFGIVPAHCSMMVKQ